MRLLFLSPDDVDQAVGDFRPPPVAEVRRFVAVFLRDQLVAVRVGNRVLGDVELQRHGSVPASLNSESSTTSVTWSPGGTPNIAVCTFDSLSLRATIFEPSRRISS